MTIIVGITIVIRHYSVFCTAGIDVVWEGVERPALKWFGLEWAGLEWSELGMNWVLLE